MKNQVRWLKAFWFCTGAFWGLAILAVTYCIGIWLSEGLIKIIIGGI